jgi:hypothetical protein
MPKTLLPARLPSLSSPFAGATGAEAHEKTQAEEKRPEEAGMTQPFITVVPHSDSTTRSAHVTYRQVLKACGKRSCQTCGGTRRAHGPYWYRTVWDPATKKTCWVYVKALPPEATEALQNQRFLNDAEFRAAIFQSLDDLARAQNETRLLHQSIAKLELAVVKHKETLVKQQRTLATQRRTIARLQAKENVLHWYLARGKGSHDEATARAAYHRLAKVLHPDLNPAGLDAMKDLNLLWGVFTKK